MKVGIARAIATGELALRPLAAFVSNSVERDKDRITYKAGRRLWR